MKVIYKVLILGVFAMSVNTVSAQTKRQKCLNHLRSVICFAGEPLDGETIRNRECTTASDIYKDMIINSVAKLPDALVETACHIQNFYIETDSDYFPWNGYAWFHDFETKVRAPEGALIRLSKLRIDHYISGDWDFQTLSESKLRDLFKDNAAGYKIEFNTNIDFLDSLIIHELIHIVDLSSQFNLIENDECAVEFYFGENFSANCNMATPSYSEFSWHKTRTPIFKNSTEFGTQLQRYYAREKLESHEIVGFVDALFHHTPMISNYQLVDPMEDLAELAAFHVLAQENPHLKYSLKIITPLGESFEWDFMSKMNVSPVVRAQRDFVEQILTGKDIRFPPFAQ